MDDDASFVYFLRPHVPYVMVHKARLYLRIPARPGHLESITRVSQCMSRGIAVAEALVEWLMYQAHYMLLLESHRADRSKKGGVISCFGTDGADG